MPVPTDEQLREYAEKLPAIYKDVLSAFPGAAPRRRAGDALAIDTVVEFVEDRSPERREVDVLDALGNLSGRGFLIPSEISYKPTDLGERLIAAVTGHHPVPDGIPDLPVPTWG